MKLLLKNDLLPKNLLRPSLLRPLFQSLRAAGKVAEISDDAETSLLLTNDDRIAELNREYRGQDKPTDVLSFPQEDDEVLGDIAISVETAKKQADTAGWPLSSELALLAVHGFLHLLGYDDDTLEGAKEMESLTRTILTESKVTLPGDNHPFFRSHLEDF